MRNTLAFLLLLCTAVAASAATRITAVLTITNLPNGNTQTLTWNGSSTRTWTNSVASASTQIQTTNSIADSVTNLKTQLDGNKFQTWHQVAYGTNATTQVVVLAGTNEPIAITIAGLWATVEYITNASYTSDFVMAPPRGNESNSFLVWQWTAVATNLAKGTQAVSYTAFPFTNFPHQNRTANPPMTNMSVYGGTHQPSSFLATNGGFYNVWGSNVVMTNMTGSITNVTGLNGTNIGTVVTNSPRGNFTNLVAETFTGRGGSLSNMVMYDSVMSGITATGSIVTISGSGLGTWLTIDSSSGTAALGPSLHFTRSHNSTNAQAADVLGHIIFGGYGDTAQQPGARIRAFAEGSFTDASAPTFMTLETTPTNTAQTVVRVRINSDGYVTISNQLQVVGAQTNASTLDVLGNVNLRGDNTFWGTVTVGGGTAISGLLEASTVEVSSTADFNGATTFDAAATFNAGLHSTGTNRFDSAVAFSRTNITTLANGVNLIDPGYMTTIYVSGPSAAYSIDKIQRGWNGRRIRIWKKDSFTLTIANESGSGGGTDADRALTGTGGNISITNNPGYVDFDYDSAASRWNVAGHSD